MGSKEKNMDLTSTENEAAKKVKKADKWADKPAMEVRDLHFSYGKNKVLKGVSLKIEEGIITTIMGANGCGKSTLFSLMTKNLYPRKGNIFLKGKNIQNLNLKEFARKVAIVQQYNSASDDITVENLVAFGRTPHKKMMQGDSAEDERITADLNYFHTVKKGPGDCLQRVSRRYKCHLRQIDRDFQIMITETIVLFTVQHLQKRRKSISLIVCADFINLIQKEQWVLYPGALNTVCDPSRRYQ